MSELVQLDLFGEVEQAEQAARDRDQARTEWLARFERADWVAPWDTAGGMKKGESLLGWRCPDPECSQVEVNEYHLMIEHGWDVHTPGSAPFDGRCHRLRLLASHAHADAKRQATACGSCGAAIYWAKDPNGKRVPVDAEGRADGNLAVQAGGPAGKPSGALRVRYLRKDGVLTVHEWHATSHFATCPDAEAWLARGTRTPDKAAPAAGQES